MKCPLQFHWVGVLPLIVHDEWEVQGNPSPLGTGTHRGFTRLEPHLLHLVCKGRRGGLAQESHPISGRNKTSAYLMQLHSSCEGWRGLGHGKGPRDPHRHVVMWLPPHFCESQVNAGFHNWKTWRTVFCIAHKTNKLQLGPSLGFTLGSMNTDEKVHTSSQSTGHSKVKVTWEKGKLPPAVPASSEARASETALTRRRRTHWTCLRQTCLVSGQNATH